MVEEAKVERISNFAKITASKDICITKSGPNPILLIFF